MLWSVHVVLWILASSEVFAAWISAGEMEGIVERSVISAERSVCGRLLEAEASSLEQKQLESLTFGPLKHWTTHTQIIEIITVWGALTVPSQETWVTESIYLISCSLSIKLNSWAAIRPSGPLSSPFYRHSYLPSLRFFSSSYSSPLSRKDDKLIPIESLMTGSSQQVLSLLIVHFPLSRQSSRCNRLESSEWKKRMR